jgi:hypothetical protein
MQTVAAANPTLNAGSYFGEPVERVTNNFMMLGSYADGSLIVPNTFETDWAGMPVAAKRRNEKYALAGCIRSWDGNVDPQTRVSEAFTMLDGLHEQIVSDPRGSGNLSPSGSWGDFNVSMEACGVLGEGWGVILAFELYVINARLTG